MTEVFIGADEAIERVASGQMVVIVDAEDRENEGDLMIGAQFATAEVVNFMVRHARGLICLPLTPERCAELELGLQPRRHEPAFGTAFTVSIEARDGVTTGISAHDRARTIAAALNPAATPADLVRPGHVFPLRARSRGVLERPGHTEAAVDLARLAGLRPAGVICTILGEDGTMARGRELEALCDRHGLPIVTIEALIAHRRRTELLVARVATTRLPTAHGDFELITYRERVSGRDHAALVRGSVAGRWDVLARLHTHCLLGESFASTRCDCGEQLDAALRGIAAEDAGVVVHLAREGQGTGSLDFDVGAQILCDLGVRSVRLVTDNQRKVTTLEEHGIGVTRQVALTPVAGAAAATAPPEQTWLPGVEMAV